MLQDKDVYAVPLGLRGRNPLMSISPYKYRESHLGTANKSAAAYVGAQSDRESLLPVDKENQTPNRSKAIENQRHSKSMLTG